VIGEFRLSESKQEKLEEEMSFQLRMNDTAFDYVGGIGTIFSSIPSGWVFALNTFCSLAPYFDVGELDGACAQDAGRIQTTSSGHTRNLTQHLRGVDAVRAPVRLQHVVVGQGQRLSSEERQQAESGPASLRRPRP